MFSVTAMIPLAVAMLVLSLYSEQVDMGRNPYLASGKTTLAGVLVLLSLVLTVVAYSIDGDPTTQADWAGLTKAVADFIALAAASAGFLAAKDANRSGPKSDKI